MNYDQSDSADVVSAAAALLSLPDLIVGGVLLARDVPALISDVDKAAAAKAAQAAAKAQQATAMTQKAALVANKVTSSSDARVQQLSARLLPTAQRRAALLAKQAQELNAQVDKLQRQLTTKIMINSASSYLGAPVAEGYALHDHAPEISAGLADLRNSILTLLAPPRLQSSASPVPSQLAFHVGATGRSGS